MFNATEYERLLLGCYIGGAFISPAISVAVFQSEQHKAVFTAIGELKGRGTEINLSVLAGELSRQGKIEKAGGYDKIAALTKGAFPSGVVFYEGEVLRDYRQRSAMKVVTELRESLENNQATEQAIEDAAKKLSNITTATPQVEMGMLFSDLLKKQFPPDTWFVENLIGQGLTVLTGASKIGKSWTALQIVAALDQGGYFMGTLRANQCDVLYLALEDTPKRIQRRLLRQGISAAFNGSRLETTRCTVYALRAYLKANPQFHVVIIDTLQKMMGINDLNDYAQTVYGLSELTAIADDLNRAIIVIHHNRKGSNEDGDHMESALGSTGINATADATITMKRKRGTNEAMLSVTGRDVEDASYSLTWDRELCTWTVTGQGALKPLLTEAQQQIIDLLESEERSWTTAEIAEITGIKKYEVSRQAKELAEKGYIKKPHYGQWSKKDCQEQFASLHSLKETQTRKPENESSIAVETDSNTPAEMESEIW
jgi:RecA-family ATPase